MLAETDGAEDFAREDSLVSEIVHGEHRRGRRRAVELPQVHRHQRRRPIVGVDHVER
jgi:hypothetical protein